jgi:hypothetical protein
MSTKRILVGALASVSLAAAGSGVTTGTAATRNLDGSVDYGPSNVWDGPNVPPGAAFECGTGLFGGQIVC